jgi:hypothetical protein
LQVKEAFLQAENPAPSALQNARGKEHDVVCRLKAIPTRILAVCSVVGEDPHKELYSRWPVRWLKVFQEEYCNSPLITCSGSSGLLVSCVWAWAMMWRWWRDQNEN